MAYSTQKKTLLSFLGLSGAFVGFQLFGPNTAFDRIMARNVWCESSRSLQNFSYVDLNFRIITTLQGLKENKLDWAFTDAETGQTLKAGNIELKVTDSRPQSADLSSSGSLSLKCPGYIELDVYYNSQLVPGGKGLIMTYAAKFLGSGGPFDGWPDFSLKAILKKTDLDSGRIDQILQETALIYERQTRKAEERRIQDVKQRDIERKQYEPANRRTEEDELLQRQAEECNRKFVRSQGNTHEYDYKVSKKDKRGLVGICKEFQRCSDEHAFFPYAYQVRITNQDCRDAILEPLPANGRALPYFRDNTRNTIYPGEVVTIKPQKEPPILTND